VIKAAIAGSPSRLRQFCREHEIDAVFSSVFETVHKLLKLAVELSQLPTDGGAGAVNPIASSQVAYHVRRHGLL